MDKLKIGWFIGRHDWAYKNLAGHLQKALPDFNHIENTAGDINTLFAVEQLNGDLNSKTILHLDGNRWYEKKTILSLEFEHASWSWGLVAENLHSKFRNDFKINAVDFRQWCKQKNTKDADIILAQNITQLPAIKNKDNVICRLGGNRSFDEGHQKEFYLARMSECGAIIATNNKLYNIAKMTNKNSFLIPNGLDLDIWKPNQERKWNKRPVVGFCGNIRTPYYFEYKGIQFVREACQRLGLELIEALYKDGQIDHDRMMQDFYYKIDILVHPTRGEGCSNTIMEACAAGVPCVTTYQAGYHGEQMTHARNVMFCERNSGSVMSSIELLWSIDRRKLLAENTRIFAEHHHDIKSIANKYRKVFKLILNNGNRKVMSVKAGKI